MKRALVIAIVLFYFCDGQTKGPSPVFGPALKQIQSETRIPILLPSALPSDLTERDIKLAAGTVSEEGYFISLYLSEEASGAVYAAGFGGSTRILGLHDMTNSHRVVLSGGRIGIFRAVSCGGSCAPANLWWEQNGVMYQIQVRLGGRSATQQQKILVQTANSMVPARPE